MKEITPKQAYELLVSDPEYIYLDVRSIPEYEAGHPERALNIPIMHFNPQFGMAPNQEFTDVAAANIPKWAKVIVGCKTGGRSARACEILSGLGYTNVANMRGGFAGLVDNMGQVVEPGWGSLGLPVCGQCPDGHRYDTLLENAKSGSS
jgi:rhodanese-related sulfurtransferase